MTANFPCLMDMDEDKSAHLWAQSFMSLNVLRITSEILRRWRLPWPLAIFTRMCLVHDSHSSPAVAGREARHGRNADTCVGPASSLIALHAHSANVVTIATGTASAFLFKCSLVQLRIHHLECSCIVDVAAERGDIGHNLRHAQASVDSPRVDVITFVACQIAAASNCVAFCQSACSICQGICQQCQAALLWAAAATD